MLGRGGIGVKRAKPIAKAIKLFRKSGRMVTIVPAVPAVIK